jgi:steroid delta-isomerase-like uncharacterized protein
VAETTTRGNSETAGAAEAAAEKPKAPARRRITKRKAVEGHIRSYYEAMAAHDVAAIGGHWREDGVDDIVPDAVLRGRAEIERYFRELFAAAPDAEFSLTRIVAGEREAAAEWRVRGTFDGAPFQGIEPTGKPFDLRGLDYFQVEDGQIVANTGYYDGAEFARQVGLLPPRDSGAERAMTSALNAVTKLRRAVNERRGG